MIPLESLWIWYRGIFFFCDFVGTLAILVYHFFAIIVLRGYNWCIDTFILGFPLLQLCSFLPFCLFKGNLKCMRSGVNFCVKTDSFLVKNLPENCFLLWETFNYEFQRVPGTFFNLLFLFHILKYILLFIRDYSEIGPI